MTRITMLEECPGTGRIPVGVTMVVGRISPAYPFLQICREVQQVLFNKTLSLAFVEISSNEGEFTINPRTRTSSSSSSRGRIRKRLCRLIFQLTGCLHILSFTTHRKGIVCIL
jgi:hypothetical protein